MAIGQVKLTSAPQQYVSDKPGQAYFTAIRGLAQATGNMGGSLINYVNQERARQEKNEKFDAQTRLTKWTGDRARGQLDALQGAPANGTGLTSTRLESLESDAEAFLRTLPEDLQAEFAPRVETVVQSLLTNTYTQELQLRTNFERNALTDNLEELSGQIMAGTMDSEMALGEIGGLLGASSLSEADRLQLLDEAKVQLSVAEFNRDLQVASLTPGAATDLGEAKAYISDRGYPIWPHNTKIESNNPAATPGEEILSIVGMALEDMYGPGARAVVTSGVREGGADPSGRHRTGLTGDFVFYRPDGSRVTASSGELDDIARYAVARGARGIGYGSGSDYMGDGMHVDAVGTDAGGGHYWASGASKIGEELVAIMNGADWKKDTVRATGVPDVWTDPRYADLPFDVRTKMAGAAGQALADNETRVVAGKTEFYEMLSAQIELGQAGFDDIVAAQESGQLLTKHLSTLYAKVGEEIDGRRDAAEMQQALTRGTPMPNTPETQASVDNWLERSGTMAAYQGLDDQAQASVANLFGTTGIVPPKMVDTIMALAMSTNPKQALYGLNTLSLMRANNPQAFAASMPDGVKELQTSWNVLQRYTPAGDEATALDRLTSMRSPEGLALAKVRKAEVQEIMKEFSDRDIMKVFDPGMFASTPDMPVHPGTQALLRQDFTELFTKFYTELGDEGMAKEAAGAMMETRWAVDTIGGTGRLTYRSPEAPGSGYIGTAPNQFRDAAELRVDIDDALAEVVPDWDEGMKFEIVTDRQTEAEIAEGKPGSFNIFYRKQTQYGTELTGVPELDENGVPTGDLMRFRPTVSEDLVVKREAEKELERAQQQFNNLVLRYGDMDHPAIVEAGEKLRAAEGGSARQELLARIARFRKSAETHWSPEQRKYLTEKLLPELQQQLEELEAE